MSLDTTPVSPSDGQENFDKLSNTFLDIVAEKMGYLQDSEPTGRPFLDECSLFGYDGVVTRDGKIVSLTNLGDREDVPSIGLDTEITIEGNSHGYVSSGHNPGDRVKVIKFIEPFYDAGNGIKSSDKIIKVEGNGVIGWIKPSEFDKRRLLEDTEKEIKKLFERPTGEET